MRSFLFIPLFSLILVACTFGNSEGTREKTREEKARLDSISRVKDSFVKAEEIIALGPIRFGISEKEFEKAKSEFLKTVQKPKWPGSSLNDYFIGDYKFVWLDGYFENDSLYMVRLAGEHMNWHDYDENGLLTYFALNKVLEIKFGKPKTIGVFPSWTELSDGYYRTLDRWVIGQRVVDINIAQNSKNYHVNLVSYLPRVRDKIVEQLKKEAESKVSDDSKKI